MKFEPKQIAAEADRCVKCGLCLPVCPTYRQTADEGESPRGRIALIQGLDQGLIPDGPRAHFHLDRCLTCRNCESVCPSGVAVTALVDAERARRWGRLSPIRRGLVRKRLNLLGSAAAGRWLFGALRGLQVSGLLARIRLPAGTNLARLHRLLPPLTAPQTMAEDYPAFGPERGQVYLFTGCVARQLEPTVSEAAIRILRRIGYRVRVPARQNCCGAMHFHNGDRPRAEQLARNNLEVFSDDGPILTSASGCGSQLREYGELLPREEGVAFSDRIDDISQFLAQTDWPEQLQLAPLSARVAVHDPCSLRNGMKKTAGVYRLLARIPHLQVEALADNETCCGAAGTYLFQQPEMSSALGRDKIERVRQAKPDLVVTSNPGCALQLRAGLRDAGLATEVLHPIELIARQLPGTARME